MKNKNVYLHNSVVVEPLLWRWHAWPHLIPPHSGGANITERHLKIMKSYVESPHLHEIANATPELAGGPFINLPKRNSEAIQRLVDKTYSSCSQYIALDEQYRSFSKILKENATGFSLEPLYAKLPSMLKGVVELYYDMNHSVNIRFIEPLLYKKYYDVKGQELCISKFQTEIRPFLLSTPRIETDGIFMSCPFSSPLVDTLARSRTSPVNFDELISNMDITGADVDMLKSYFTQEKPVSLNPMNQQSDFLIRYLGHACALVKAGSINILIDPMIGYGQTSDVTKFNLNDLPETIDYVLVTHNHQDHLVIETLLQLRHKIKTIVVPRANRGSILDPSIKLILEHIGFKNIIELDEFEEIIEKDVRIIGIPFFGEHGDLCITSKLAYWIDMGVHKCLFVADSNNLDPDFYHHLYEQYGAVDYLFLGMECEGAPSSWIYGPMFSTPLPRDLDESRRLNGSNCDKALRIVDILKPKAVYVYAMGQEPWLSYLMGMNKDPNMPQLVQSRQFVKEATKRGIVSKRLYGCEDISLGSIYEHTSLVI